MKGIHKVPVSVWYVKMLKVLNHNNCNHNWYVLKTYYLNTWSFSTLSFEVPYALEKGVNRYL